MGVDQAVLWGLKKEELGDIVVMGLQGVSLEFPGINTTQIVPKTQHRCSGLKSTPNSFKFQNCRQKEIN